MGVLAWIMRRRSRSEAIAAGEVVLERPPPTAAQRSFEAPRPTPSMRRVVAGPTRATPVYRIPGGTPSTERLHNPRHVGR